MPNIFIKKDNTIDWQGIFALFLVLAIIVFVVVMRYKGTNAPKVTVNTQQILIDGQYGSIININDINKVSKLDTYPQDTKKINGFESGSIKHGKFSYNGSESYLYVFSTKAPYIYIITDKLIYIINFNDSNKTNDLYDQIMSVWNK